MVPLSESVPLAAVRVIWRLPVASTSEMEIAFPLPDEKTSAVSSFVLWAPGTLTLSAEAALRADIAPVEATLGDLLLAPVSQPQFDALVSFAFSIGVDAFARSDVLRRFNAGEPIAADKDATVTGLARLLGFDAVRLQDLQDRLEKSHGYQPVEVISGLKPEDYDRVLVRLPEMPGVVAQQVAQAGRSAELLVRLLVEPHPEQRELRARDQEQRHEYDRRGRDLVVEEDARAGDDEAEQEAEQGEVVLPSRNHAVVLVSKLHLPTLRALAYARATRPDVLEAITVNVDDAETRELVAGLDDDVLAGLERAMDGLGHGLLELDGGAQRIDGAAKFGERPVAGQLDKPTSVLGQHGIEAFGAVLAQARQRPALITPHQAGVNDNVCSLDSR